jgi:hypothetical protein
VSLLASGAGADLQGFEGEVRERDPVPAPVDEVGELGGAGLVGAVAAGEEQAGVVDGGVGERAAAPGREAEPVTVDGAEDAPALVAGPPATRIGRYRLLEIIGEGGFGTVWMAEQQEPVRRKVACKVIKLGMDTRQVVAGLKPSARPWP